MARDVKVGESVVPGMGRFLKELRRRRGLTLKQVASASREVAKDTSGTISNPYLSQLESDRASAPSLPKLLTLSRLYGVDVGAIAEKAPPPQRDRLFGQLDAWLKQGRDIPLPLDYYIPPDQRAPIEARIDGLLASLSRNVSLPLQWENIARDAARNFVQAAATLPYLDHADHDIPQLFWAAHLGLARRLLDGSRPVREHFWADIHERFSTWLFYDTTYIDRVIACVSAWNIDFTCGLSTCRFRNPADDQVYGFDALPFSVAVGVRAHQLAARLAAAAPPTLPAAPAIPDLIAGLRRYLRDLIDPEFRALALPDSAASQRPSVPAIVATVCALSARVPAIADCQSVASDEIERIAAFLHSALSASKAAARPRAPQSPRPRSGRPRRP